MTRLQRNQRVPDREVERLPRYSAYGCSLVSTEPLLRLPRTDRPVDLLFECHESVSDPPAVGEPLFRSEGGEIQVFEENGGQLIRFQDISDFLVLDTRIVCRLYRPEHRYLIENQLLGYVLACWFERQGLLALHAAAVVVDERAIGFLSTGKGGKTSLAASLVAMGHHLLTDDLLVVRTDGDRHVARPGYPQMRMWPQEARHFLGRYEDLDIYHPGFDKRWVPVGDGQFGRFWDGTVPLSRIFLPDRREGGEVEIGDSYGYRDALVQLLRYSFLPELIEALGWQKERLDLLIGLATEVPVQELIYPSGLERLEGVARHLERELIMGP